MLCPCLIAGSLRSTAHTWSSKPRQSVGNSAHVVVAGTTAMRRGAAGDAVTPYAMRGLLASHGNQLRPLAGDAHDLLGLVEDVLVVPVIVRRGQMALRAPGLAPLLTAAGTGRVRIEGVPAREAARPPEPARRRLRSPGAERTEDAHG